MKMWIAILTLFAGVSAEARSVLEQPWQSADGRAVVRFVEFNGKLTLNTRSYYSNGTPSDYFFEFWMPEGRDVRPGEVIQGRLRSLDGYYGCVFDEHAQMQLTTDGTLKVHYPLLTFHRETRSVRDGNGGRHYRRVIDWNGWGWVETVYSYPVERWRVISSECVVNQRNWVTNELLPLEERPVPRPE